MFNAVLLLSILVILLALQVGLLVGVFCLFVWQQYVEWRMIKDLLKEIKVAEQTPGGLDHLIARSKWEEE